jgi:hypothetical protein
VYRSATLGIYDLVTKELAKLEEVVNRPVVFWLLAVTKPIATGEWPILGNAPFKNQDEAWPPPQYSTDCMDESKYRLHHKGEMRYVPEEMTRGLDRACFHFPDKICEKIMERLLGIVPPAAPPRQASKENPKVAKDAGNFYDAAVDWALEFVDGNSQSKLAKAFDTVIDGGAKYLEVDEAHAAIAAAEVVAALLGKPASNLPDELEEWVSGKRLRNPKILPRAVKAVKSVARKSELKDLWQEAGRLNQWKASVNELLARLK